MNFDQLVARSIFFMNQYPGFFASDDDRIIFALNATIDRLRREQ